MPGTPKWQKSSLKVVPKIRFTLSERFQSGARGYRTPLFGEGFGNWVGSLGCRVTPKLADFGTAPHWSS